YEQILNEDNTDAEAYWSLVLCRYGIEYVEDPTSHKRIPTVNRAQFTSVFDDEDYKSAISYADSYQKTVYEKEANTINEIQKGILAISQKEEPFDVFICYKETDNSGRRTPDSVLANDLYHQLKQEGFKVFFARITLEDKLGTAYEPYIFAALNSSKVMVVLGTKPEYFNAVWVKNEWSRYLALIKNGAKKMLIPAYKDMDPYDLPEEFSHLQAQDMSKLGFMQDLIRGIKKIAKSEQPKQTVVKETVAASTNVNTAPLLERAFMFLEDRDWESADEYCEKVLDIEPKCAEAYLGKLMAELRVSSKDGLCNCGMPFDSNDNYAKVMRFGDGDLKTKLQNDIDHINTRNENNRLNGIYAKASQQMNTATTEKEFKIASETFNTISHHKDAKELSAKCLEKAEIARKDNILSDARDDMTFNTAYGYRSAIRLLQSIPGWKDADSLKSECENKIRDIKAKEEAERLEKERLEKLKIAKKERIAKRNKKIAMITTPIVCAIVVFIIILNTIILPPIYRKKANEIYGETLSQAKIGDTIKFGSYEQDNNKTNGKEKIEWIVLDKQDNRILVISKNSLDCKPYNESAEEITWETCSLRKWLNDDFADDAFSEPEKSIIPKVSVEAHINPEFDTDPGDATEDKVFLLSITEANKYFGSDSDRECKATDYAVANGVWKSDSGNCWWWLRSPGGDQSSAAGVYNDGGVDEGGSTVSYDDIAVRPAMWINLDS
ncbi:MAG: toll/interleukin-1 receptor domain-containing protein, partial [Ruminococcaceae bacterium]|nr:toll/interleukin-1 receptor domain-containing protein [Oscillospiraceae bacterium]